MSSAHKTSIVFMVCMVCLTACNSKAPTSVPPTVADARDTKKPLATMPATALADQLGPDGQLFGDAGNAHRIVFCFDAAGSMINKMSALNDQISKAVNSLRPSQSFEIIFYQDDRYDSFMKYAHQYDLVPATPEAKKRVAYYLEGVTITGSTDPILGIEGAFKTKPDLIYLLTDGDFADNDAILKLTRKLNSGLNPKVRINTIAFTADSSSDDDVEFRKLLQTIAKESGGMFRNVKKTEL